MPQPVTITYTLHPTSSSGPEPSEPSSTTQQRALQNAIAGIRAHLPLRNLHWKSSTRTSLRTIQEVDVRLVELGEVSSVRDGVGSSVLEAPLVNLCLVVCEDAEVYKNQTRNFIRDWLSLLAARRTPHAPLIVLVNPSLDSGNAAGGSASGSGAATGKSVWGKDKGVLGKLKGDFNVGKRDRCVQLNLPAPGVHDPAAWPELINKLKESLVTAFDSAIIEREEEVKRGESQRLNVGWNFCTWFLLKESLAQSFESVNLPEDSLIIYEELEASFFQVLKEQNLSWFGIEKLGANHAGDDSLPILDTSVKPYRDMMKNSTISIFDFRIYLFARQGVLLGKLGRITEVAKRGQWFVASLTRRLREAEVSLAEHFIESWTYTACMDIVSKCDQWSQIDRPNGDYSGLVAYESARSELLDIARIQVERIGVSAGHLPPIYPFNPASSPYPSTAQELLFESSSNGLSDDEELALPPQHAQEERPVLSNEQIIEAQRDEGNCRALYLGLTRKTVKAYEACGKVNSVIRLKADLAALALYTKDWASAYDLSRSLARDCAELLTWEPVSKFALEGALRAHRELHKEKDEDWDNLALAYLRVCAVTTTFPRQSSADDQGDETQNSIEELERVIEGLRDSETEQDIEGHKAFSIRLESTDSVLEKGEQTYVQVEITNALTIPIYIDNVSLDFTDLHGEIISFINDEINLQPGVNTIKVYCSTSTQGLYTLQGANIVLGSISFIYNKAEELSRLKVRRHTDGVALDDDTKVVVEIRAGGIDMRNVRIGLRSLLAEVTCIVQDAQLEGRDTTVDGVSGLVAIGDLQSRENVTLSVPYSDVPQGEYASAQIILQYETEAGPREWIDTQTVFVGLPLTVNVQDFFRPDCLVSHFTIASDGKEYLRIGSVSLQPLADGGYTVDAALLRLQIGYRSLDEEVKRAVNDALRDSSRSQSSRLDGAVLQAIRSWPNNRSNWLAPYLLGEPLGGILRNSLTKHVAGLEGIDGLIQALNVPSDYIWRTLEIPVDIPQYRLLTSVRISPVTPLGQIYEGRAIPVTIRLATSYAWAGGAKNIAGSSDTKARRVVFDIHQTDDWLICGKKKGYYTADPATPEEQRITLIPLRAGQLFLPSVSIHLLPHSSASAPSNPTSNSHPQAHAHIRPNNQQGTPVLTHAQYQQDLICETYLENAAECITVLPAKKEVNAFVPIPVPMSHMNLHMGGAGGGLGINDGWDHERM
ncbi:hypothetical protein I316_02045 [Kwoniella heveanensis BCC8398]|uniref:Trafficking protein particle complex subunit 10 n=1 Tax=Kwoniella heveanensis BCC8398 TaxID=1296120 RepID=A0A1B9GYT6_9TREE|nr:hypothetical protein I316_02045 [Kwoniella heveanensis BCC8398]